MREDTPRPSFVPAEQIAENWERTFGKKPAEPQYYKCVHGIGAAVECKQCKLLYRRKSTSVPAIHADKRTR